MQCKRVIHTVVDSPLEEYSALRQREVEEFNASTPAYGHPSRGE